MHAIAFETNKALGQFNPARMDIACFIGFVCRRPGVEMPAAVSDWWHQQGWLMSSENNYASTLHGLPVPLESWEDYLYLFGEQRNDRKARVRGQTALTDPVVVVESDREFHVLVDNQDADSLDGSMLISLTPDIDAERLSHAALTGQLNDHLSGAKADIVEQDGDQYLEITRTDNTRAGELTVYANRSLGFNEPLQDDVFALTSPMAAAVHSFFQQGGRKCYVIALETPLPLLARDPEKIQRLLALMWGDKYAKSVVAETAIKREHLLTLPLPMIESAVTARSYSSPLALLLSLHDASYLCLPDLVDLLGHYGSDDPGDAEPQPEEVFVECSEDGTTLQRHYLQSYLAPVFTKQDYAIWKRLLRRVLEFLSLNVPTMQLVASLPLPDGYLHQPFESFITGQLLDYQQGDAVYFRHLQLAYPWLKTNHSQNLPQQLLPPEGSLLGLLARNALVQGAYRSIAGSIHDGAYDLYPQQLELYALEQAEGMPLVERVNCFEFSPNGIALLSDVTVEESPYHRFAVVRRIMMLVQRSAYQIGLNSVFENSGSALWRSMENGLSALLTNIYRHHGLRGKSAAEAFDVTCDRSTMTQADIDNGRLIARIEFRPAVPVEKITVALAINNDGNIAIEGSAQ